MNLISKIDHNEPIIIGDQRIEAGKNGIAVIRVGRLPSDTSIDILVHVYRSKNPGPVILLQGGVHGDEINGVEIVRKTIESGVLRDIDCGSVIAIPLVNVFGFINFSRDVPDGKDVNRSFPGTESGSLASIVASKITKNILPYVDFAMDFHTGGASRYNYPQLRITKGDLLSQELAYAFDAPIIVEKPLIPKSFRKITNMRAIPTIVYEGGESERYDHLAIEEGCNGIVNVLKHLNGVVRDSTSRKSPLYFTKTHWIRASHSGMFHWVKSSGCEVYKGELLGYIRDPYATMYKSVVARKGGFIIGHNNATVVNQGDALFHIAEA